jgi:hypothetical protein
MSSRRSRSGGLDREHVEAVVEVGAESALADRGGKVPVGRAHDPNVKEDRRRAADALELSPLDHAQ